MAWVLLLALVIASNGWLLTGCLVPYLTAREPEYLLLLPPASSRYVRLHGPYISEQESARLASFLRKQGKPVFDESITAEEKTSAALEFEKDDLYDEASRIVVQSCQASISYLQRRLRIGFSRAARLVDMMEADGLVSAAAGVKAREVLVSKDYFDEVDAQLR